MGRKTGFGGRRRRRPVTAIRFPGCRRRRTAAAAVALAAGVAAGQSAGPGPFADTRDAAPARSAEEVFLARANRNRLDALHRSGVALSTLGRLPEAEARLAECVRADPGNPVYMNSLIRVRMMREGALTQALAWPRLPIVQFREATLAEALQDLQERSRRLDTTRRGFNLVYRVPAEARRTRISLELQDVPMDTAVRYVCELAGVPCEIEGRTVVVGRPVVTAPPR